jgi:hypothetical protein
MVTLNYFVSTLAVRQIELAAMYSHVFKLTDMVTCQPEADT